MAHLSDSDRQTIDFLRNGAGVLADVEEHKIDQTNGVIMVACADGDQMPDIFLFQKKMEEKQRKTPRIHTIALNGGALLIPENSPVATGESKILIGHIRVAMDLKKIKTIALYAHAPCGAAGLCKLSVEVILDLLIQAKMQIKREISDAKVACFFHVDYGDGKKRTYFVSRDKYEEWKQSESKHKIPL